MNNVCYFLTRTARQRGDSAAIFHGDTVRSYRWLDDQVSRLASGLGQLGLKRGDRVGLVLEGEPRGLIALLAPLRAGMVIVPMNPKLHPKEHLFALRNCGAKGIIISRAFCEGFLECEPAVESELAVVGMDSAGQAGVHDFQQLIDASHPRAGDEETSAEDVAWLFYTSGTTGKPKGAMLTHRNLISMAASLLIDVDPVNENDRLAYLAPLSHSTGLMSFHHIARGSGHVFPTFSGFKTTPFYRMIERHRVSTAFMVPTMIQSMLDDPSHRNYDISSLRTVFYGGAPSYVDRMKEAVRTFGPIFVQGFAQAEAPMACTSLPKARHNLDDPGVEYRLASAGRENSLVQVRIFGPDDREVPPNTPGEIVVKGPIVMAGYWDNPQATESALRNGWLHTGDVGHLDADGYLFITDRLKDMIISGGSNIYPREIEEVLYAHPGVHESTVFGVPDPKWGERVIAAVVAKPGAELAEQDLIEWCKRHLASFKKPSEIRFVGELPKSGYGKILKRETKKLLFPAL